MIGYFPTIYEDEWLYSVLSRAYVHTGVFGKIEFLKAMFDGHDDFANYSRVSPFTAKIRESVLQEIGIDREQILSHTLFGYYQIFLEKKSAENWADDKYKRFKFLSYCPLCVLEDREKYGEGYFHLKHQISGVNACIKHNCRLIHAPLDNQTIFRFHALEELVDEMTVEQCSQDELLFCKYINVIMEASQKDKTAFSAKTAFLYLIKNSQYYDVETGRIDVFELIEQIKKEFLLREIFQEVGQFFAWLRGKIKMPDAACKILFILEPDANVVLAEGLKQMDFEISFPLHEFPPLKTLCLRGIEMTDQLEYRLKYM